MKMPGRPGAMGSCKEADLGVAGETVYRVELAVPGGEDCASRRACRDGWRNQR